MSKNDPAERAVREIRRKTRKQYSAEEKIRIVVSGLRGEDSIAELCRREGIAEGLYGQLLGRHVGMAAEPDRADATDRDILHCARSLLTDPAGRNW